MRAGAAISTMTADPIANELGRLPLALSHAAAYLKRKRAVTADIYLAELSRHMKEAPKGAAYKASVFATFQLAMEQAEAEAPGARAVLSLAALYAPDNIPEELFKQSPEIYPPALQPVAASEVTPRRGHQRAGSSLSHRFRSRRADILGPPPRASRREGCPRTARKRKPNGSRPPSRHARRLVRAAISSIGRPMNAFFLMSAPWRISRATT